MNAQEWNKLKKNWSELLEVYPSAVIDYLYSKNTITYNDKKKVEKEKTPSDKIEKLLSILKSKPTDKKAFDALMDALEQDRQGNFDLAKRIKTTETNSDASLKSEDLNQILEIEETCKQKKENLHLKMEEIKPDVPIEHLALKIEEMSLKQSKEDLHTKMEEMSLKQPKEDHKKMEEMSPRQLIEYLRPQMEQLQMQTDILDTFFKETITGSVFLTMTENDFKEVLPSANFGIRRFLSCQINDNRHPSLGKTYCEYLPYHEYLRKFNSEVQHTDKYIRGRCIDANVNTRGRKTDPVRNFHLIEDQNQFETVEFIASKVIPFVSACLNDRRDGTIYFGISPQNDELSKPGEIVGVGVSKEEVQAELSDFLHKSFVTNQQNIISGTVRDAKFVPVVSDVNKHQELHLWVVEVDVVPSSIVLKDETVKTKLKCLPIYAKKCRTKGAVVFRFSIYGTPEIISADELYDYEKDQKRIVQQRREEEEAQKCSNSSSNLRTRLLNLLTGGTEVLQDTIYPFFMTSSIDIHMDKEYLSRNMTFIKGLHPEVVFDFDPNGSKEGIYNNLDSVQVEVMRVLTTDNFEKGHFSKEEYKNFTDGLAIGNRIQWVFCNGYEVLSLDPMEPTEWNRKRRNAFQESLRFYKDNFDEDRIIVIICLFSKKYEVMIEACEEVLTKLPDNWMLLADSEDTVKLWQDQIITRNKAEKHAVTERCIVGMPWEQVNLTIKQAVSDSDLQDECLLPTSTGALVDVREKKLKDWCDIDVLSAGDFIIHENEREKMKKEVEERFYRGEQASWLNFYFHDQVLKRDIHDELLKKVNYALEGKVSEEGDKVTSVSLWHQPGAGGTTSARQVLWDLRKTYRCCIVNTITDQTCDQLDEFRAYGDSNPKPLLILIDNEDDDKMLTLIWNLEERGRKNCRSAEKSFNVYCTVITCNHVTSLPKQIKRQQIALRQELTRKELDWFKEKNDSLESRFNKDREKNVNPKFLISFNILRENFNKEYISKVVKEFSDDVVKTIEVKLLKIISLLNTYDMDFKPVHVACLDKILEDQNVTSNGSHVTARRNMKWEANLTQGVRVLLNLSSNRHYPGRDRSSIRVFSKIIAQEILTRMKERTGQKESEMMLELLESGIFELESFDSKKLQALINNVIKKRELRSNGKGRNKFSKFVIYVKINEGAETAVSILEQLFELNQDPFTAQLISRFYIDMKNWSRAEHFAKRATSMLSTSSFLWDTYGQVYKNQLTDKISPELFRDEDIHGVLELSKKCIDVFRKEQKLSENEVTSTGDNNFAGYFGELRAIVLILSALKMCPSFNAGQTLHRYLIDEHFQPSCLNFLNSEEMGYIKNLEKYSKEAMRRLDEEYLQMKGSSNLVNVVSDDKSDSDKKTLLDLKVNLDDYFGVVSDTVPRNLGEPESCDYRRRRAKKLGATSLYNLLTLRQGDQGTVINKIYSLITKNINTRSDSFDDLRILLDTVTVLMTDNNIPEGLQFEHILDWCKKLYTMNKPQGTDRHFLEIFLYFVMYNFPTKERQVFSLCMVSDLLSAIEKWQEAFKKNYPRSAREAFKQKRETTLFFLGNGPPLHDIVHHDDLSEMEQYSRTDKWDVPEVREKLRMMSGSLCGQGEKVTTMITTKEGNNFSFSIQTSHRVTKKDMWQKRVFFYVGFSFSGPRAYGMSTQELGIMKGLPPKIQTQNYTSSSRVKPQSESHPILYTLILELNETKAQMKMEKEPKKKSALSGKIQKIKSDINKLLGD